MFEKILDSIIDGTATYRLLYEQLEVNNELYYLINDESESISVRVLGTISMPAIRYSYYKDLKTNLMTYKKFEFLNNEEIELPSFDADKDELFNFNLMYSDHSSVMIEKIEKSFIILRKVLKDMYNDFGNFDMDSLIKNSGL